MKYKTEEREDNDMLAYMSAIWYSKLEQAIKEMNECDTDAAIKQIRKALEKIDNFSLIKRELGLLGVEEEICKIEKHSAITDLDDFFHRMILHMFDFDIIQDLGISELIVNEYKGVQLFIGLMYLKAVKSMHEFQIPSVTKELVNAMIPGYMVHDLKDIMDKKLDRE